MKYVQFSSFYHNDHSQQHMQQWHTELPLHKKSIKICNQYLSNQFPPYFHSLAPWLDLQMVPMLAPALDSLLALWSDSLSMYRQPTEPRPYPISKCTNTQEHTRNKRVFIGQRIAKPSSSE